MAGQLVSQDLLEELDSLGRPAGRGTPGHENPDAFRMGRHATRVTPVVLSAKLRQFDDKISGWIMALTARENELGRSGRYALSLAGHGIAIITGLLVLAAAFGVDFMIIQEFWKRVLSNEFGEVPASLAMNVLFKSAQVLFATLAFHFMLETVGETGRKVFIMFIFALTFCMLLGIGLIIAKDWLPPGSTLFGIKMGAAVESADNVLKSLGLGADTPAAAAAVPGAVSEDSVRTVQTVVWMGSLSVIFLIVTGVGSLCMGIALRGFRGIFGDLTFDPRAGGAAQLSVQGDELVRVTTTLNHLKDPKARWMMLHRHLSDFVISYYHGLQNYESAWFGLARLMFPREKKVRDLQLDMDTAKEQVEDEWTLEFVRERHPPVNRSSTGAEALDDRKEPGFDGHGETQPDNKVVPLKKQPFFGRKSSADDHPVRFVKDE